LLSSPVFIGKTGEKEVGAAAIQPPQKLLEGHVPYVFSTPWYTTSQSLGKWGL